MANKNLEDTQVIETQRKAIHKAMKEANIASWPYGARFKLSQRLDRKLSVEFLAEGFLILGEGENSYIIKVIEGTDVKKYLMEKAQI